MAGNERSRSPAHLAYAELRAQRAAGGGGVYVGRTATGWRWGGAEHATLVLGPPRSGKTTSVVVPSIAAAAGAVVSTSTKPDIATVTLQARREIGPCLLFDPTGSVPPLPGVAPMRWSPLPACRQWDEALILATSMVDTARRAAGESRADGGHWTERAAALLAPLLHAAALDGADMATVLSWVDCRQAGRALAILDSADAPVAADLLAGIAATDSRELSGIWSTTSGALRAYRSAPARHTASGALEDVGTLIDSAATIYLCASSRHQAAVAPLVVGLLADIRAAIYHRAARWEAAGRPHDAPRRPEVLFALDEVANIAPIPDLPSMVSEAGGQGLTVLACLQDLSQARRRWGVEADGLLSLFGTTVVLPGIGDVTTLQALSTLAGDVDVATRSVSTRAGGRRPAAVLLERVLLGRGAGRRPDGASTTTSTVRRRRLPVDAIAHGRPGAALVVDQRNTMSWVTLTPWFDAEPWRTLLGSDRALGRPEPTRRRQAPELDVATRRPGNDGPAPTVAERGPGSPPVDRDVGRDR